MLNSALDTIQQLGLWSRGSVSS